MARFSTQTIQMIRERMPVSEVMRRYSTVEKRGNDWWCCCPIHGEKTPSLIMHNDTGTWHCFGCSEGGSIFDLVCKMEKLSFTQAVRLLAKEAQVPLEDETPQQKKQNRTRELLFELYERLENSLHYFLTGSPEGEQARSYLEDRGVSPDMWERFNLGFAPDDGMFLHRFLSKRGYSDEILKISGLFSKRSYPYSIFRNRLMFPVRDWRGRIVAFSGRDLADGDRKYINSPETAIYSKKHQLFGIYESLESLRSPEPKALLCEGNFDVVALHQAGADYAMASLGTSFTDEQAALLKRYTDRVQILFDSDEAGRLAACRTLVVLRKRGISATVSFLQTGKDASEVLQNSGPDVLRTELESAQEGFDFLVDNALEKYDVSLADGKFRVFEQVKPYIEASESSIVKDDLLTRLAERLGVSRQAVVSDFAEPRQQRFSPKPVEKKHTFNRNGMSIDYRLLLIVANNRECFESFRTSVAIDDLKDKGAKQLFMALENGLREGVLLQGDDYFLQLIDDSDVASDLASSYLLPEFREDAQKRIREGCVRVKIRNLKHKCSQLREALEFDDSVNLIYEYQSVNRKLRDAQAQLRQLMTEEE